MSDEEIKGQASAGGIGGGAAPRAGPVGRFSDPGASLPSSRGRVRLNAGADVVKA